MASNITNVTGIVAAGLIFPVEVLMKSAPARIAISLAWRTLSNVESSPVSKITFKRALPQASLIAAISSKTKLKFPERNSPREMTISNSSAPASTAILVSANFISRDEFPEGKAVATEATLMPVPFSASTAVAT